MAREALLERAARARRAPQAHVPARRPRGPGRREAGALPHGADRRRGAADAARRHRRPLRLDRAARAGADRQDDDSAAEVRRAIAGRTLSIGVVAAPDGPGSCRRARRVEPGRGRARRPSRSSCRAPARSSCATSRPHVEWTTVPALAEHDLLADPGILHVTLPGLAGLQAVHGADPLEAGVGELPPDLQDRRARGPRRDVAAPARAGEQHRADGLGGRQRRDGVPARPRDGRARRHRHRPARPGAAAGPHAGGQRQRARCASPSPAASGSGARSAICSTRRARSRSCRAPARPARRSARASPSCRGPDRVFTLSPADGTLRFGDGRHGRRPPAECGDHRRLRPRAGGVGQRAAGRDHVVAGAARGREGHEPGAHLGRRGRRERRRRRAPRGPLRPAPRPARDAAGHRGDRAAHARASTSAASRWSAATTRSSARCRPGDAAGCVTVHGDPAPRRGAARDARARPGVPGHRVPPPRAAAAGDDRAVRARADATSTCG